MAANLVANAESNLGTNDNNLDGGSAQGLYQYIETIETTETDAWSTAITRYNQKE